MQLDVISIDADLQDDINVIRDFVLKFHEGFDIVYGVRASRKTDTWFKRTSALTFYRIMTRIGIQLIPNHADFRLMSKRAVLELCRYGETNVFLRGIVPLIGYAMTKVYYDRKERFAGRSKFSIWFLGGLQLLGIGIIGEYIGKIFIEVKCRPKYAVEIDLYSIMFEPVIRSPIS